MCAWSLHAPSTLVSTVCVVCKHQQQQLDKARCGILIGSAFGGMQTFATAVEALETQSEFESCAAARVGVLGVRASQRRCWVNTHAWPACIL